MSEPDPTKQPTRDPDPKEREKLEAWVRAQRDRIPPGGPL